MEARVSRRGVRASPPGSACRYRHMECRHGHASLRRMDRRCVCRHSAHRTCSSVGSSRGGAGWREGWTEGSDRWDLSTVERMIKTATEYLGVLRYEDGRARASQHQLGHMYASPVLCPAASPYGYSLVCIPSPLPSCIIIQLLASMHP